MLDISSPGYALSDKYRFDRAQSKGGLSAKGSSHLGVHFYKYNYAINQLIISFL